MFGQGLELGANRNEQFNAVLVGLARLPVNYAFGAREQVAYGERFAGRRGVGEEESVQIVDGFGAGKLAQREVALCVCGACLFVGATALHLLQNGVLPCAVRLGNRADQATDQREENHRRKGGRSAMPAHEPGRSIRQRVGAGKHWPVV